MYIIPRLNVTIVQRVFGDSAFWMTHLLDYLRIPNLHGSQI